MNITTLLSRLTDVSISEILEAGVTVTEWPLARTRTLYDDREFLADGEYRVWLPDDVFDVVIEDGAVASVEIVID